MPAPFYPIGNPIPAKSKPMRNGVRIWTQPITNKIGQGKHSKGWMPKKSKKGKKG